MAKYVSINELDKFRLHDAKFVSVELKDNNMIWILEGANVTTENSQNHFNWDMEADTACFTFFNYHVVVLDLCEMRNYDSSGKFIRQVRPRTTIPVSDHVNTIYNFAKDHGWISSHTKCNTNSHLCYSFDILTYEESYIFSFEFSKVVTEWSSFKSKAWYVDWDSKK